MKIYFTFQKTDSHEFLFGILKEFYNIPLQPLSYNENGKPYLPDNPIYFSLTNSEKITALAVSSSPVGLDAEYLLKKRRYAALYKRLSPAEQAEITDSPAFYRNWTAKESYVKFLGGSIGESFSRLRFVKGELSDGETRPPVEIRFFTKSDYLFALCQEKTPIGEKIDFISL